jgi:signal transduction histidine kinase
VTISSLAEPPAIVAADPVNILIVDDEPRNLVVLETVLDDPGYRLIRANSGDQALLALMANEFAVLVLDVRMPGMTGFELAKLIKERKKTARVPIIFLTAYFNEDQHILEGYGTGAVDYLHKPVNAAVLRSKVAVFAELHRKGRALQAANLSLHAEVTERRRAEARLSELNESLDRRVIERTQALQASEAQLREADRRKDEFLATLAHELRNPLAPVRTAAQIVLRQAQLEPELARAADVIERQVRAMSRLIDDLMDVSRINQGRLELRRQPVSLTAVLREAIESTQLLLDECQQELVVALPQQDVIVDGDATRLAQAFMNLINNAAKYTDRGGRLEICMQAGGDLVRITFSDTGIGIAPERLLDVFEMFSQVETALSRSRGGLGIGLALTRRLIELHGGTVTASSAGPGQGSSFEVVLPVAAAGLAPAESVQAASPQERTHGLRILIADDNVDAAETMGTLLEMQGHTVHVVHDGAAAVAAVQQFHPQVALLDIGMPKLNGYEACRQIRAQSEGAALTMVAITGWGQADARKASQEAGFDLHLVKPVDLQKVEAMLAQVRHPKQPG